MAEDSKAAAIEHEIRRDVPNALVVWTNGNGQPTRGSEPRSRELARDVDLAGRLLTTVGERQGVVGPDTILVTYRGALLAIGQLTTGSRVAILTDKRITAGLLVSYVQRLVAAASPT